MVLCVFHLVLIFVYTFGLIIRIIVIFIKAAPINRAYSIRPNGDAQWCVSTNPFAAIQHFSLETIRVWRQIDSTPLSSFVFSLFPFLFSLSALSTPQLLNSSTPHLLNSSTPPLLNSTTPQLLHSLLAAPLPHPHLLIRTKHLCFGTDIRNPQRQPPEDK